MDWGNNHGGVLAISTFGETVAAESGNSARAELGPIHRILQARSKAGQYVNVYAKNGFDTALREHDGHSAIFTTNHIESRASHQGGSRDVGSDRKGSQPRRD